MNAFRAELVSPPHPRMVPETCGLSPAELVYLQRLVALCATLPAGAPLCLPDGAPASLAPFMEKLQG